MIIYSKKTPIGAKSVALVGGSNTGLMALDTLSDSTEVLPGSQDNMGNVAMWGNNNRLPQDMVCDIEHTGVLSAAIDAKARIAVGRGPMLAKVVDIDKNGQEQLEFVINDEIQNWLELNNSYEYSYASAKDFFSLGNGFTQLLFNRNNDYLAGFKRHDPCECRFSIKDPISCQSEFVYLSGDWEQYIPSGDKQKAFIDKHTAAVPLLDIHYPTIDLAKRKITGSAMMAIQYPLMGRNYYSPAPWYCAKEWVDIARSLPKMKDAMFKNQMQIKYIVEIAEGFWNAYDPSYAAGDDDKKIEIRQHFYKTIDECLVGEQNSYKSLFSTQVLDPISGKMVPALTVTPIDDKIKDGKLLPDGAAADSQILFALSMNPALIGLSIPGSGAPVTSGSGSNIREAYTVQLLMLIAEQVMLSKVFKVAKQFNKWDRNLVLRFPNQVPVTLNTGSNTQAVA